MRRLKWVNVPLPVQHLVGLLLGTYLHIRFSQSLFSQSWIGAVVGWPMIAFGIWIALKAALEAGELNVESPTQLLTRGPYARSRNPMYVGWTLLHLGVALAANSLWILGFFLPAIVFTHLFDIRREERKLRAAFPDQYPAYQERVRRYF